MVDFAEKRVLRIYGNGAADVEPTAAEFKINFTVNGKEYKTLVEKINKNTADFLKKIEALGIEKDNIRLYDFNIDSYDTSFFHSGKMEYSIAQILKIRCPIDNDLLMKVMRCVTECKINPQCSISYSVDKKENGVDEALINALNDAKKKAEKIAKIMGVTLGNILDISYAGNNDNQYNLPIINHRRSKLDKGIMDKMADYCIPECCDEEIDGFPNVNPEPVRYKSGVTVIWEIYSNKDFEEYI